MRGASPSEAQLDALPSQARLKLAIIFGASLIAFGLVLIGIMVKVHFWDESNAYTYPYEKPQTGIAWYMWVAPLTAGVVITCLAYERFSYHFRQVMDGVVAGYSHWTNYRIWTTYYYVTIYGLTRAGEMRYHRWQVEQETWRKAYVGQRMRIE
ncbi:MAG TPA: hypothetical protein VK694_05350 [Verrucomicrobiae bacterium]|nr:hypothetical protein [Verrucomicrobiae bacterium]